MYSCGILLNTEPWIGRRVDMLTGWQTHLFALLCPRTHPLYLLNPGKDQPPDVAGDRQQCHLVGQKENCLEQLSLFSPSSLIWLQLSDWWPESVCLVMTVKWFEFDLGASKAFKRVIELVLPASLTISLMRNGFLIGYNGGVNNHGPVTKNGFQGRTAVGHCVIKNSAAHFMPLLTKWWISGLYFLFFIPCNQILVGLVLLSPLGLTIHL